MQWLADSRWAVRNAIPLTPPGNIRMLDAFEARMAQGQGSPGLASYLRRAGVQYVVVRNDLQRSNDVPDPVLVHQALAASRGLSLAATFGPDVGGGAAVRTPRGRVLVNGGWQSQYPAIEIFEVDFVDDAVTAEVLPTVVGGPEDLLALADAGLARSEPTRLAADSDPDADPEGPVVLTDGMLDRERFFGRVHDGASSVITPGDVRRSGNPTKDYLLPGGDRWRTTARLLGASTLSASSSQSDANAGGGGARPGDLPYAALDGLDDTEWLSAGARDEWWQVDLDQPRSLQAVTITAGRHGSSVQRVRVETPAGISAVLELEPGDSTTVQVGNAAVEWIRVEAAGEAPQRLAIAEVEASGVDVRRPLVLPEVPEAWGSPDRILLRSLLDARSGCAVVDNRVPCVEGRDVAPEEPNGLDRIVTIPEAATYDATMTAVPRAGTALASLLQQDQPLNATGSSTAVPDLRASGLAAVDGTRRTAWTPLVTDARPQLALNWLGERRIARIQVALNGALPVRRPTELLLLSPEGRRRVELDDRGMGEFRPLTTDSVTVRVIATDSAVSLDEDGSASRLPVGIGEVRLRGVPFDPIRLSADARVWPCGTGPTILVDDVPRQTRLIASPVDLYQGESVRTLPCEPSPGLSLAAGETAVRAVSSPVAVAERLVLQRSPSAQAGGNADAPVDRMSPVEQRITPDAGSSVLALRENSNPGWNATQGGADLASEIIDGWQQGWRTDGSDETVDATFAPNTPYRWGLLGGGAALLLLSLLLLVPTRRWPGATTPPLDGRVYSAYAVLPVVVLVSGLLAGWVGVAVGTAGVVVGLVGRARLGPGGAWLVAVLMLAAGFAYFLRPWADSAGWAGTWSWPAYLVVLALSAAGAWAAPLRQLRNRMVGISTTR